MKKVFKGMVNGQMFTTVEDYNKAIMEAVYAGKPVTSSISYEEVEEKCEKCECGCENGCKGNCNKLDDQKLSYFCPRYVYGTLTGDLEQNEEELVKIHRDLDQRFDEFECWYENNTCNCEVERVVARISNVTDELEATTDELRQKNAKLVAEQKEIRSQLEELAKKLTQVEAEIAVLDQERRIIEEVTEYYEDISDLMEDAGEQEADEEQAPRTEIREKVPQKDLTLYELFTNKDNALDNLLENVGSQLNENDKAEIKKYANDLVSQFNRLLRCF